MKKITLLLLLISLKSFSQIHFLTHKDEKISYSEYDSLKYLLSLDQSLLYSENVVRYYDNGTTLLYSVIETSKENTVSKIYLYPTKTIEYTTTAKVSNNIIVRQGALKINGVNNFLSLSSCDNKECLYLVFVNKDSVYKGTAPIQK